MENKKALVAAIAACLMVGGLAGVVCSQSNDAATNEGTYDIPLFVGDSFAYTPSALLSGTVITASGDGLASNGGWLIFEDGMLSGKATGKGDSAVELTGTWTSGPLVQVITQTINFKVYDHTVITSTSYNGGAVVGETYSYALTFTGNGEETVGVSSLPSWMAWNDSTKVLSGTPTGGFAGTTPSVTLTVSNATTGDSDSITLNLTVYEDVAFLSTAPSAVINGTLYRYNVVVSSVPDNVVTMLSGPSWLMYDEEDGLFGTPDLTIEGQYVDVQVTLRAYSAALGRYADQEITIRVWVNNDFAAIPTINMVATPQGLMMSLSVVTANADLMLIEFGDGTETFADPDAVIEHLYADAGTYVVRGTASNEYGSDSMVVMFDAVGDEDTDTGNAVGWFEKLKDNTFALAVLIIGIIALIAFALGVRHAALVIIGIILIIVGGLFLGTDIASLEDLKEALRGLMS